MKNAAHHKQTRKRNTVATRLVFQSLVYLFVLASPGLAAEAPSCGGPLELMKERVDQWSEPCEYTFRAGVGYFKVTVENTPGFEPVVSLIDPEGKAVASESGQGFSGGRVFAGELPKAGVYKIRVGSVEDRGGRLVISVRVQDWPYAQIAARRFGCVGGNIFESPLTKTLSGDTGTCSFDYLGMSNDTLTISVTSTKVDPKVKVYLDDSDSPLDSDDDSGDGSNSLISGLRLTTNGKYKIVVSSRDNKNGKFTITVTTE